jgi:hypothetical protein
MAGRGRPECHQINFAPWRATKGGGRRGTRNGAKDRADVSGLRHMTGRVVVEVKDYGGKLNVGPWLTEAEIERGNDDAVAGLVVAKRRGTTNPADQIVLLTLGDLVALLTGQRPPEVG